MFALLKTAKRRIVAALVAFILTSLTGLGLFEVTPEIAQQIELVVVGFLGLVWMILQSIVETFLQNRVRAKGEVVEELLESNRVSSLRKTPQYDLF